MLIFCVLFQLSILNYQYAIDDSVAVMQSRRLLIDNFRAGRLDSVALLIDSIDHHHHDLLLLWPAERLLLYYWIERHQAVDSLSQHFDSVSSVASQNHPSDQMVWNVLLFHSLESKDTLVAWIDQTGCGDDLFDFRVRLLETMLSVDDEDQLSVQSKIGSLLGLYSFEEKTTQETKTSQEVQIAAQEQQTPCYSNDDPWRVGCSFGLGPTSVSDPLAGYLSTKTCLSFSLNVNYQQWYFSFLMQPVFARLKRDILAENGAVWESGKLALIGNIGLLFGYSVIDNRYLKISPMIGLSISECSPTDQQIENNSELAEVGIRWGYASMYGIDTDIKLYKLFPALTRQGFLASFNVRLTYIPEMFGNVNARYSGNMLMVTFGIGMDISTR